MNVPQFLRFCGVGTIGFIVDAGLLTALVKLLDLNPYVARVLSITVAITATWALNRSFTFATPNKMSLNEWGKYGAINTIGAGLNYGVFCIVLMLNNTMPLMIATAIGSVAGLIWNFGGSRLLYTR